MPENQEKLTTITDQNLQEMRQHGTKDFPLGVYQDDLTQFEQGIIPWHWHEEIQFDLVVNGRIYFQIGSRGILAVKRTIYLYQCRGSASNFATEGYGRADHCICLRDSLLEADVLSAVYQKMSSASDKGPIDSVVFDSEDALIGRPPCICNRYRIAFARQDTGYQIEIKGLLCCLLVAFLRGLREKVKPCHRVNIEIWKGLRKPFSLLKTTMKNHYLLVRLQSIWLSAEVSCAAVSRE